MFVAVATPLRDCRIRGNNNRTWLSPGAGGSIVSWDVGLGLQCPGEPASVELISCLRCQAGALDIFGVGSLHKRSWRARAWRGRITAAIAATGTVTLLSGFVVMGTAGTAQADDVPEAPNDHQIAICHATGEGTDGKYVVVYPSKKQISEDNGHRTGKESVHPDDIIPPFAAGSISEAEATGWEAFGGQNWDSAGQAIFNNGCVAEDDDDDEEEDEKPDPVTSTSSSSRVDCTTATVVTTTTTTTTEYVEDDGEWVLGTPQSSTSTSSRAATNAELDQANCPRPDRPSPIVTTTSVDDVDCEDNVVTTTTTTTTVDWVFDVASRTWVKGQPQVSTAQTVRDATEAECPAEVLPSEAVDVCPNITGDQAAVPEGYSMKNGKCVEDEVKGVETEKPEPTIRPVVNEPPEVVPTAVDAGFGPAAATAQGSLLGQALVGAGLMMLLLAGTMQMGRRERGAHEA